ncbi:hypothetical protein CC1G_06901 [Coprinopsis cinerea okayama7|uniref:F-box domain-containing protein n=1 Tax=Coprinopsis cinerea (strain Okayama-7 / 130 / ATCC MYA-4618 / FGSC 9003) TaxID=240176 RepID=A8N729_COPC7|nr:hypothetical protein CC1G_06901 [Coprinopsis cinerea okayama7\|eukprot:XP_001830635.2 hypothetical protein CC1G_06901 [Coprinopsis cinerea okayama7\
MAACGLPPEIWSHIVSNVPVFGQRNLLQVSRSLHEIARSIVFSAVKIYIIGGDAVYKMLSTEDDHFKEEATHKLTTRSYELLRQMTRDPSFARVVRDLTVVTSSDCESTFEYLFLADAVKSLPNLQTFQWIGPHPPLADNITESLPDDLQSLSLKTYVPPANLLHRFHNIAQLAFPTPFFYPDDDEARDYGSASATLLDISHLIPDFDEIMSTMALDNLHSLTINAVYLPKLPIKVIGNLTQLDICVTTTIHPGGLDLVFRHALSLESLTLFGYVDRDVFSWFPCEASDLPALRSFRLSCDRFTMIQPLEPQEMEVLLKFLGDRPNMRRLYLRIPSINFINLTALAPVIRSMKTLEVFGIHTGAIVVDDWFVPFIASILPASITALHLAIDWNGSSLLPLVDYLANFPRLQFFHLYGVRTRITLLLEDAASTATNLTLIGRNRSLFDIVRGGPELELKKWPRWKTKFCTEVDFQHEDHFWLYQYN